MDAWNAVGAIAAVVAAGIAAWAAVQSKSSARQSNEAATALARIENDRRHSELCPQLRISTEPSAPGVKPLRLRIALVGPSGLDRLDSLTVTIRNDKLRRGDAAIVGGATAEEIEAHIWGPFRFTPKTGPDKARADDKGRATHYAESLPLGEELVFQLEPTTSPGWSEGQSQESWERTVGSAIRLTLDASRANLGSWTLPCEIVVGDTGQSSTLVP